MVKHLAIKTTIAVLSALATAIGYSLNITQVANIGPDWLPLITFGFFCIIIIWVIIDLYRVNTRLLDTKPKISVEPLKDNNKYYLKVHNIGSEAVFKAQIQLTSEDDPSVWALSRYDGYWKEANSNEARIFNNQDDYIVIAERISYPPDFSSVHLRIIYYDPKLIESLSNTGGEQHRDTSTHWIGSYIEHPDGSTEPLKMHEYRLNVTISSVPSLREGVYKVECLLTIDDFRIIDSSQLTSYKKHS